MPAVLQALTVFVPARYFIEILRDIYLKGLGFEYFWKETLFIVVFGVATLALAARRFQKRIG
jgi:ABC-2 type transport system permease protein